MPKDCPARLGSIAIIYQEGQISEEMGVLSKIHSYDEDTISFYNIDKHVSQIDFDKLDGYGDLLHYIQEPIATNDENRNIYLARAIVRLMFVTKIMYCMPIIWYMELVIPPLPATFHNLCRRLDIPCRFIKGKAKDFKTYRHETYPAVWCAFMSNGLWHLVDLDGLLCGTTYHETEGRIMLESDGETIIEKQEDVEGVTLTVFDDFWFCTNPSKFIFYDFPDDQEWNMLASPKTFKEFQAMPFMYIDYHLLGLQFLTECFSRITTKDGQCTVSVKADPSILRSKCFPYTLSLIEGTGDISGIKAEDLPLLVRYAPGIDTLSFNIRFPVSGEFVFEVLVMDPDNDFGTDLCFDIVIVCDEADPNCRKLPIDAGIVGFGYGHTAKEAGLKNPSKASPTVNVNQETGGGLTVLTFQIEDDYIDTIEYGSDVIADDGVNAFSETHVDAEKGKLTVVANVKTEGEFALSLTAKPKQSNDKPDTVLNYLLTTHSNGDDVEYEKLVKKRKRDLILEEKMEKRITMKKALTNRIIAMEKELEALRKIIEDETVTATVNASLEDDEDVSDRYVQSNEEGSANTSAAVTNDSIIGNTLSEKAVNVSAMNPTKKSKMCYLM